MNKKITVLTSLLIAVAITSFSVCKTYAKFTEDFDATSSDANIAKWDVTLLNEKDTDSNKYTFDLLENATNASLTAGENTKLLAPGSKGSFTIKVQNSSDVNATVSVELSNLTGNVPLKFSTKDGDYGTLDELNTTLESNKEVINGGGATEDITIYWAWAWTEDDETDLASKDTYKTVTVDATVTVSQVNPTA